jgi:hypothetical protein
MSVAIPALADDGGKAVGAKNEAFWKDIAKNFTNIQSREVVLKAVFGPDYVNGEADVRAADNDDGFFL